MHLMFYRTARATEATVRHVLLVFCWWGQRTYPWLVYCILSLPVGVRIVARKRDVVSLLAQRDEEHQNFYCYLLPIVCIDASDMFELASTLCHLCNFMKLFQIS